MEELRVCCKGESEQIIDSSCEEFKGIPLSFPSYSATSAFYREFYDHVCSVLKGKPYSPCCVGNDCKLNDCKLND